MRVTVLFGSPRNGNTYRILKEFEKEIKKIDSIDFDYIFLNKVNLEHCRGCYLCMKKGAEACPIKDDREIIFQKMKEADGVVFASPVYALNVSAYFKNFVDRFSYLFHRPAFYGKAAIGISTVGGYMVKDTLDYISNLKEWGFKFTKGLGIRTPPFEPTKKQRNMDAKRIQKSANRFYKGMKDKRYSKATFSKVLQFETMSAFSEKAKDLMSADYEYYIDKKFFCNIPVNPIKKVVAQLLGKAAMKYLQSRYLLR
jgi:multimeric flavodoxin WrbA